jgi:hypothetical protein
LFKQQTLDRLQTRASTLGYPPDEVIYSPCWDDVLSVLTERLAREALATDLLDDDDLERLLECNRKGLDNSLPWYDTVDILLDLDLPEGLVERAVERQPDGRCVTRLFWDCHCEEGYIHPVTLVDCPACGARRDESPLSSADNVLRSAQEWNLDQGLVACVRRASPVSWDFDPVAKGKQAIQPNEGPLAEQHVNSNRSHGAVPLTSDDWLESAYEDTVSGWSDEF